MAKIRIIFFFFVLLAVSLGAVTYEDAEKAYKSGDFVSAYSLLRTLAEKEDGRAQYSLSLMLAKGEGCSSNIIEAYVWAKLAAENAPDEYFKARSEILIERLEKKMNSEQLKTANVELVKKKEKIAEKKANPDYVDYDTAVMTFKMGGYAEGVTNLRKLAEKNDERAIFFLGEIYQSGEGVTQDYQEAAKWFQKGAELGSARCQLALADLYYNGLGLPKDEAEAVVLTSKAAEQGYAPAQWRLAGYLSQGKGTDQNQVEALKWAILAVENGNQDAEDLMRALKYSLSPAEVEQAKKLAEGWRTKHDK